MPSHALVFRIAFAAAGGLTLGEVLGWDFPFLPAMLAVQLLAGRGPISVKQAIGFVAVMALACGFATLVAELFVDSPLVLVLVLSLLVFLEFLLIARGRAAAIANIFLITTAVVPLLATESTSLANGLVFTLIAGSVLAVLLAFTAHAIFPSPENSQQNVAARPQEPAPAALALANTVALIESGDLFHADTLAGDRGHRADRDRHLAPTGKPRRRHGDRTNFRQSRRRVWRDNRLCSRHAAALPAFLFLVTLLGGLLFGDRIRAGGELAPIYTVGLMTFLIVLGLGISPLPEDSGTFFIARVFDVMVAAVYAIGMASLLRGAFGAR